MITIASGLEGPDDLALGGDGSIYVSEVKGGRVIRFAPDGKMTVIVSRLKFPEGLVALSDGSLIIAENGTQSLLRYDAATQTITPLITFTLNTPSAPGVDGIAFDALTNTIIVPLADGGQSRAMRVSLDGKNVKEIARGFAQPSGAWVERDGSVLVTDKGAGTIKRIRPNGKIEIVSVLPSPDDVIADAFGNLFAITLHDNALHWITAGRDTILLKGLHQPEGVIFDAEGNLIITEEEAGKLLKVIIRE